MKPRNTNIVIFHRLSRVQTLVMGGKSAVDSYAITHLSPVARYPPLHYRRRISRL